MSTLFLTSSAKFITAENLNSHLSKPIEDSRIAYVTTAAKKVLDTEYFKRNRAFMDERNWQYDEIDLADMTESDLERTLNNYDIVRVEGGNTFYLLAMVRKSGFANVLRPLLAKGLVYVGSSAGAYIASPSIVVASWSHQQLDWCGVTDYTAMNLVPYLIKAHYEPSELAELKDRALEVDLPIHLLTDKQALLVQDGQTVLLGEGEQIVLND